MKVKVKTQVYLHFMMIFLIFCGIPHMSYGKPIEVSSEHRQTLVGHTDWVRSVDFNPKGRIIASASADKTIRLWNVKTGKHEQTLTGHTAPIRCIRFSPSGEILASGSQDGTLYLWDVGTGEHLKTLTGHTGNVYSVDFSPNGQIMQVQVPMPPSVSGTLILANT